MSKTVDEQRAELFVILSKWIDEHPGAGTAGEICFGEGLKAGYEYARALDND